MFIITSNGALISLCDKPRYIRINEEDGIYIEASPEDATGVAVGGVAYNLPGSNAFDGADTAEIAERDGSEYVLGNMLKIEENKDEADAAFVSIESAVCDLDASTDERISAVEDFVCELDIQINGGAE